MKVHAIPQGRLLLVSRSWWRRSRFTSVERFTTLFPHAKIINNDYIPRLPTRLLRLFVNRAKQDGYGGLSIGLEIAALWQLPRYRPRIVHFLYADHDYHYFAQVAQKFRIQTVGTFWFSIEEFERRIPDKAHLRYLALVIASGRKQLEYLGQFVDSEKLAYLPLGVDAEFFCLPSNPEGRLDVPLRILQVGVNRRNFPLMVEVFTKLRRIMPDLELHLVGCDEARPFIEGLEGVVVYPLLDDEQLLAAYQRATILLLPLLEGGSSNSLNEALATGLPIVATRMPNLEDYTSDDCVSLCPPGDSQAMVQACLELLTNRNRWYAASIAARRKGEEFDWPKISAQLLELYRQHLHLDVKA